MKESNPKLVVPALAASLLLTGCWPFDNDDAPIVGASPPLSNEPPSVTLTNTNTRFAEDADTSSAIRVADIEISDDASGTNTLSLAGSNAAFFEIIGSELRLGAGAALDFETRPSLAVTVEIDDAAIGSVPDDSASLSITVTDVNEVPGISLANAATTVAENADTTTAIPVAEIVITDDALGTNALSISGGDAGLFEIVGTELRLMAGVGLDFETNAELDVTVEVDDAAVGSMPDGAALLNISITDSNEPPAVALTNTATTFAEDSDTAAATLVAEIIITDDALGMNTLSIAGADSSLFEIVGAELRLVAGAALDFETNPSLDIAVEIDDAAVGAMPDSSAPLAIAITDIREILQFVNGQDASVVIGQADFLGEGHNQDGFVAGNSFDYTYGNPAFGNGVLYLPDYYNYRVLGFNGIPAVNNQAADFVLGQNAFTSTDDEPGAAGMDCPTGSAVANSRLLLIDCSYSRGTLYVPAPSMGPGAAAVAFGQANFSDQASACTSTGLSLPEAGIITDAGQVIVADSDNNRVLIWNSVPGASGTPADLVLGQTDFTSCTKNAPASMPTDQNFDYPAGVWSDGEKLIVIDHYNHRAMIWTSFPTSNGQAADLVLGQGDFTHNALNDDEQDNIPNVAPTARTLSHPDRGVTFDGLQLCIADTENSRVLIWDGFPSVNFQPADRVLGQADFLSGVYDRGGPVAANTLDRPTGCLFIDSQLLVSDTENSRFLVFDEPSP